ncbi:MAG TPA: energy-coupling factor ABC transporter permease [Pirellulaceae bacterium]|jgi:cobalt/nickel transport system permease protein
MHIPEHALDPTTCAVAGAISAAAVGYALHRVRQEPIYRKLPLMTIVGASIFAGQMLNFPISLASSGHFLGGALAGIMLGPWAGMLVMAAVVALQCFVLHDGGVSSLGANILNMAVVGSLVANRVYGRVTSFVAGRRGAMAGAAAGAWCSVMASALACSVELSLGGGYAAAATIVAMLSIHSLIAVGETVLTGLAVAAASADVARCTWRTAAVGLTCIAIAAVTLSPFACRLPDGLETVISAEITDAVHP